MTLHVFGHVEAQKLHPERIGQLLGHLGLTHTGRAGEHVRTDGLFGLTQARAGQLDGRRKGIDGLVLAEHHALEVGFEIAQQLGIGLGDRFRRNPRNHSYRRLDILDADGLLALVLGHQHLPGTGFVNHIDCLVGQFAVVDIAGRKLDRCLDRVVGIFELVVILEIRAQPLHDLDGIWDRGLVDVDLLEPAHESPVLFKELTIFLVGGRTNAADRSRGQSRLQKVRSIERSARGCPRADHRMDLVDEKNDVVLLFELFHDRLEPFLEIAAITRARQKRTHVERIDYCGFEHFGNVTLDDPPGQTFGDSGLANAGIAHIERIVLGATAKHLNCTLKLDAAADQRIDLSGPGLVVEIDTEIGKRRTLLRAAAPAAFLLALEPGSAFFSTAHGPVGIAARLGDAMGNEIDRVEPGHVLLLEEIGSVAFALGKDRNEHVGPGHFLAPGRLNVNDRALDDALEGGRRTCILAVGHNEAVELLVDELFEIGPERLDIDIAPGQNRNRVAILGQRQQQVFEGRKFMTALPSQIHGLMQRLFETARE